MASAEYLDKIRKAAGVGDAITDSYAKRKLKEKVRAEEKVKRLKKSYKKTALEKFASLRAPRIGKLRYRAVAQPKRMVVQLRSPKDEINEDYNKERSWMKSEVSYF